MISKKLYSSIFTFLLGATVGRYETELQKRQVYARRQTIRWPLLHENHLHGGARFDKVVWDARQINESIVNLKLLPKMAYPAI